MCAPVVVAAKKRRSTFALAVLGALAAIGCQHTWQGVKEDTRNAVDETGRGLEKAGKKMQGTGDKKATKPTANRGDAGAALSHR
jgi:hypothetical protein